MDQHALLEFIKAHAAWAGPVLGVLSFIEGLTLVGLLVPLTVLLAAAGAAIGLGHWSPLVLVWSVAGVSLGNTLSYEVGRRLPERSRCALARRAPRLFAAGVRLFETHGAGALILARFVGPPASAPFFAGYLGLSRRRFYQALALCALWVPSVAALGYLPVKGFAASGASAATALTIAAALLCGLLVLRIVLHRGVVEPVAEDEDAAKEEGGAPAAS